ncbi:hypothetical protein Tco_1259535, partial [Tanacetum coccineum]
PNSLQLKHCIPDCCTTGPPTVSLAPTNFHCLDSQTVQLIVNSGSLSSSEADSDGVVFVIVEDFDDRIIRVLKCLEQKEANKMSQISLWYKTSSNLLLLLHNVTKSGTFWWLKLLKELNVVSHRLQLSNCFDHFILHFVESCVYSKTQLFLLRESHIRKQSSTVVCSGTAGESSVAGTAGVVTNVGV